MEIEDIMSIDIVVCNVDSSIYDTAKMMIENDIGFIPVSDKNKIVGVVTDRDIATKAISNVSNTSKEIKNFITGKIIYLNKKHNINDCMNLMGREKVKRVIITDDNNKMIGIVSLSDIINHMYNEKMFFKTLKNIYSINKNNDYYKTEIDEFYL